MKAICSSRNDLLRFVDSVTLQLGVTFLKPVQATVEEKKSTRTLSQMAFLHGICYPIMLTDLFYDGQPLGELGWRKDDVHTWMLGEYQGWEELKGPAGRRRRPVERSPQAKMDYSDLIAFVQQKASEYGCVLPDPEEMT